MRKKLILFWIGLGASLAAPANCFGQLLSCTVSTEGVKFRAEGIADLVGDVLLQCLATGPAPAGQSYITTDLQIFINTNLANRLQTGAITDAVLIVNENHAAPTVGSTLGGPAQNVPVPQFGELFAPNALQWRAVKIPLPGGKSPDGGTFPSRTNLRVTNLRVNPLQLGISSTLIPTQVVLFSVAIADAAKIQGGTEQLVLGTVQPGLFTSSTVSQLSQCQSQNIVNGEVSGPPSFSVRLSEGYESAFRPLGTPSTDRGVHVGEDGYPIPGEGANGGGADQGTRFMLTLNNVGAGIRLAVPKQLSQGSLTLQLTQSNLSGSGKFNPVTGTGLAELPVTGTSARAVYEVIASSTSDLESIQIPVTVGFTADPSRNLPALGQATILLGFAPLSTVNTPSAFEPLPRFGPSFFSRNAFSITNVCAPGPAITSVVPNSIPAAAGTDLALQVFGTGFGFTSAIEFNGTPLDSIPSSDFTALFASVPAKLLLMPGTVQLDVLNPGGKRSNSLPFTITPPAAPKINSGGAVNAANSQPIVARGSLASVYGASFSTSIAGAATLPLPTQLSGTRVFVDGNPAPLVFISPAQINFQMPFEEPLSGNAQVTVSRDGTTSAPVSVALAEFAPGIFRNETQPVVLHADYSPVTPDKPAALNEVLIIYATGLGGLNYSPPTGAPTPASPPVIARINPTITVGGQTAPVLYAGLASGFVGLAQINFRIPATLPAGPAQPLALSFGNALDTVTIAVASIRANQFSVDLTDVLPGAPLNSDNLRLEYTVHNPDNFVGTLIHRVYISKNPQPTTSDQVISTSGDSKLQSGDNAFFNPGNTLPDGTTPGRYYVALGVVVSGDNDPAHITISKGVAIDVVSRRAPFDLSVILKSISPITATPAGAITVSYSVQEPSGISGTFTRSVYIGTQNPISTKDTLVSARTFDLVRGAFATDSTNNVIPAALKPGNYFVGVIVQTDGDTNPANNTSFSLPITIGPPASGNIAAQSEWDTARNEGSERGPKRVANQ